MRYLPFCSKTPRLTAWLLIVSMLLMNGCCRKSPSKETLLYEKERQDAERALNSAIAASEKKNAPSDEYYTFGRKSSEGLAERINSMDASLGHELDYLDNAVHGERKSSYKLRFRD